MCSWTAAALLYIFSVPQWFRSVSHLCPRPASDQPEMLACVGAHSCCVYCCRLTRSPAAVFLSQSVKTGKNSCLSPILKMLPSPDSTLLPVPLPLPPSFHPKGSDHVLIRGALLIYILLPSTLDSIENLWEITEHSGDHCSDIEWIKQFSGRAVTTWPLFDWVWHGSFNSFLIEKFSM